MSRKKTRLPSGLELVRRHIAVVRTLPDKMYVWMVGDKEEGMTIAGPDIQAFRAWWDAPKRKRVKAEATPEPPAEPKPGPWVASPGEFGGRVASVDNKRTGSCLLVGGLNSGRDVANALADRVAKLLNESEVTG